MPIARNPISYILNTAQVNNVEFGDKHTKDNIQHILASLRALLNGGMQ
jgi:hypothetical protein